VPAKVVTSQALRLTFGYVELPVVGHVPQLCRQKEYPQLVLRTGQL
jgi:hypothetical protein